MKSLAHGEPAAGGAELCVACRVLHRWPTQTAENGGVRPRRSVRERSLSINNAREPRGKSSSSSFSISHRHATVTLDGHATVGLAHDKRREREGARGWPRNKNTSLEEEVIYEREGGGGGAGIGKRRQARMKHSHHITSHWRTHATSKIQNKTKHRTTCTPPRPLTARSKGISAS